MTNGHFSMLLLIFVSTLTWRITNIYCMEVEGVRHTCENEGEQVHLDDIDKQKCYFCICRNGYVECDRNPVCPEIRGCHMIEKKQEHCCARCKGCYYNGTYYESGEEWVSKDAPCMSLHCEAGVITKSKIHCHVPCKNPDGPEDGKCCATCPDCRINGYIATDDRDVTPGDLCVKCRCSDGSLTCVKKACPVLQCAQTEQIQNVGECCPSCQGNRERLYVPHTCVLGYSLYAEGGKIPTDHCTMCTCSNQTSICERENCPPLECSPHMQRKRAGSCCKECVIDDEYDDTIAEVQSQCRFNGHVYEEGQTWSLDSCTKCACKGKIICMKTTCNESLSCPIGSHLVHQKGECCKKCVENKMEATCVAFGDPHYRTFDGKMYRFHGLGKYQFVSDCHNHTFSVRVTNDFRNRSKSSTMTKRVRIKFGDSRVNLGQNCRVKLNGHRVTNSISDKLINIVKDEYDIKVTLNNSIKILWNCHSYLEVTVPIQYKNKLCGLCGNFNLNVQDDMKLRKGGIATENEMMKFGFSWCVGKECGKTIKKTQQMRQCKLKPLKYNKGCANLTSSDLFHSCHKKLSYNKYYSACLHDMCDCPSGKCYCDSLTAYAHECRRLGIQIDNWQKNFHCANLPPSSGSKAKKHGGKVHSHPEYTYSQDDIARLSISYKNKAAKVMNSI